MPNYCYNVMVIEGGDQDLANFKSRWSNTEYFLFCDYLPEPAHEDDVEYDWYLWRVNNWGVKWDLNEDDFSFEASDDSLTINFSTPWGPPNVFVKNVAQMYPELQFKISYFEPGMAFGGYLHYHGDELEHEVELTYESRQDYTLQYNNPDLPDQAKMAWIEPSELFSDDDDDENELVQDQAQMPVQDQT